MNIFGEFYGRNGVETVNLELCDDKIQELIDANADDEDKFERLVEEGNGDGGSIGYYTAFNAIADMIRDNLYLVLPISIIEEEFTYGVGMDEDAARIAFTKTDEEV